MTCYLPINSRLHPEKYQKIQKMRYKISTQYLSTKFSPFQILLPCGPARLRGAVRALGLVAAPVADVFEHEKGYQITQSHSCIAVQIKNIIL